jgi:YVTN family beta-propeller protein
MSWLTVAVLCSMSSGIYNEAPSEKGAPAYVDAIAYCTRADNKLHLLSATDLKEIESCDFGLGAHEMAISPDGRWLVGCAYGGPGAGHQPADKRVAVFDLAERKVHKIVELVDMQRPNDVVFLPRKAEDERVEALVTVEVPPNLVKINVKSGDTRAIKLNDKAGHMLAVDPSGSTAFVAHVVPGSMSVVDLSTETVVEKLPLRAGAEGIAISPDGFRVWVASNRSNVITIIDAKKREVVETVKCEGFPFRMRFSKDGSMVAVSCPASGEVALYDSANPAKVDRVSLKAGEDEKVVPTALAFTPSGKLAVLCEGEKAEIVLVDVRERLVIKREPALGGIADALTAGRVRADR